MNAQSILVICLISISSIAGAKKPDSIQAGNKQGSMTATTVPVGSPLVVSENGHYLTKPGGKPIFWFSDTQWVINKFTDEQVIKILDDRKSKGFNVIQVFAARSWDKNWWVGDQSWAQTDANGNFPFVDDNPVKLNKAYWDRWGWIIDEAKKRDMYFLLLIGGPLRMDAMVKTKTLEQAYEYAWQIGNLFIQKSNLIISVSEDNPPSRSALGVPGFDAAAEGITDGLCNVKNYDGKADYNKSLITYHTWASSSEWFHSKPWLDMNGVQGSRNENDLMNHKIVYQRINMDYNRTNPVKPVLFLEGSYEKEPNMSGKLQPTTPRNVRMQFLYAFFGGSAGFSYGHWDNWRQYKSIDYLNSPGANQVSLIASFIRKQEWFTLRPDSDIIIDGVGTGEQMKVALKSEKEIMVFYPETNSATVVNKLNKKVKALWFDPRNGKTQKAETINSGQSKPMSPPSGWEDAVLILK